MVWPIIEDDEPDWVTPRCGKLCRDLGHVKPGRFQKASRLAMRSQQRADFFEQFRIAAALLAQEFLLPLGRHLQRRLQQFIHSFPAFSVHQENLTNINPQRTSRISITSESIRPWARTICEPSRERSKSQI